MLIGSLVNAAAIIAGAIIGTFLKKGFPENLRDTLSKGVALCVIYIGIDGMLEGQNTLIAILSIVLGAIIGELLRLDDRIHQLGDAMQARFSKGDSQFSEGFVNGTLLFCIGAMAVVGSLDDGLTQDHSTLFAKSILDGVSSIVFSSTMGIGVAFSAIPVFLYQGCIALCANVLAPYLTSSLCEMKCVGSMLILAIGLNMLGLTKIKVMNYLFAIFLPILFCLFM